jgi:hypothetical protein
MQMLTTLIYIAFNQGKGTFGKPYDSTQGISSKGQIIIFLILIVIGLYVTIRVRKSLRNEEKNKKE